MLYFILGAIKLRTWIIITDLFDENMGIFSNSFITLTGVELSLYRFNKFDKIISVGTEYLNVGCRKKIAKTTDVSLFEKRGTDSNPNTRVLYPKRLKKTNF